MSPKVGALCCALLAALLVAAGDTATSARTGTVPDRFEVSGWWNTGSPTTDTPERKWTYHQFPVTCNTNPALPAIQVLWVTKPGQTSHLDDPAKLNKIRNDFNRAASIFTASAKKVLTDDGSLLTDKSPRFVTRQTSGGRCHPTFTQVQIPAATYDAGYSAIWSHLRATGYNAANRKYLTMVQSIPGDDVYGGVAEIPGYYDGDNKTMGSRANDGSHLLVVANTSSLGGYVGAAIAHELGHSLGALASGSPNNNTRNIAHPTDCGEVMCYTPLRQLGQVNVCGLDNYSNPEAYRLDCGKDDYFNNAPAPGSYLASHFNISTDSTYIWGGGSTVGLKPDASLGAVVVEH